MQLKGRLLKKKKDLQVDIQAADDVKIIKDQLRAKDIEVAGMKAIMMAIVEENLA